MYTVQQLLSSKKRSIDQCLILTQCYQEHVVHNTEQNVLQFVDWHKGQAVVYSHFNTLQHC